MQQQKKHSQCVRVETKEYQRPVILCAGLHWVAMKQWHLWQWKSMLSQVTLKI